MNVDETYLRIAESVIHELAVSEGNEGTGFFRLFRRNSKQVLAEAIQKAVEQHGLRGTAEAHSYEQQQEAPMEGVLGQPCPRCGDPLDMKLLNRPLYICRDCYTLLLDNKMLKIGTFWDYTHQEIDAMFDELNRRLARWRPLPDEGGWKD